MSNGSENSEQTHSATPAEGIPPPEETPETSFFNRLKEATSPVLRRTWTKLKNRPSLITLAGVTAFCTVATLVATAANVWIVYGQLKEMQSSSVDAHNLVIATRNLASHARQQATTMDGLRKAAEAQARATHDLSNVAGKQVSATMGQVDALVSGNQLNRTANRPWVGLERLIADHPIKSGVELDVSLEIKNAGKAPAHASLFTVASGLFDRFTNDPPFDAQENTTSQFILVPGEVRGASFTNTRLSSAEVSDIQNGTMQYYIYAKVVYTEVGTRDRFVTLMCFRYMPRMEGFTHCPTHNRAT